MHASSSVLLCVFLIIGHPSSSVPSFLVGHLLLLSYFHASSSSLTFVVMNHANKCVFVCQCNISFSY